jgi:2-hydroxychromene-2-carboxylate isomerase
MRVDFYYSIGSRYSYLASTQIAALEQATGCQVDWHPVNSVRLLSHRQLNPFQGEPAGQYEGSYRERDAKRWADFYQILYNEPRGRVQFDSELLARACTAMKRLGKGVEFSHLLFAAMFQDSVTAIAELECRIRAEACGISAAEFDAALSDPETVAQLDRTIDYAHKAGIFGVPTFMAAGEMFWGNDRIVLLRHYLQGYKADL